MYTVDTNILIYHANGDTEVTQFLSAQFGHDARLFLPTIAVVEFFSFPALTPEAERVFTSLLPHFHIVPLDYPLSLTAARLRRDSTLKLGDSVIAATALMTHSPLVTRNLRDFKKVHELEIFSI